MTIRGNMYQEFKSLLFRQGYSGINNNFDLMGSQLQKGQFAKSTINRTLYSYYGLHLFDLSVKANTNAKGKQWKTKKKLSKLELCKYLAEHNKSFRKLWLTFHPGKNFPKHMSGRTAIGSSFYRSNVADGRRSNRIVKMNKLIKKMWPGQKQNAYYFKAGKKIKIKL